MVWPLRLSLLSLSLLLAGGAPSQVLAQGAEDPFAAIAGVWRLPGTTTTITIYPNHKVEHSRWGRGDLRHDNVDYYVLSYRERHWDCHYAIDTFAPNELSVVRTENLDASECDLGELRRAPWSEGDPGEAKQIWEQIKGSRDVKLLLAFRNQYSSKHPEYIEVANKRIEELGGEPEVCESGSLLVQVANEKKRPCLKPGSGKSFKDCPDCPEMVVIPAGSVTIGSPESEPERVVSEGPQHEVKIAAPFAAGKFAVTFAEWDACTKDGGCGGYKPSDEGWGRGDLPVINITWKDAKAYVAWLSKKTGKEYRLLSEAEFEYVARAGTTTPFWWGQTIEPALANYDGAKEPYKGGGAKGDFRKKTVSVSEFKPNPWGLYQVLGNVWQWTEDCWIGNYASAPADGSARTVSGCNQRTLRGGSWAAEPRDLRAAARYGDSASGFRFSWAGLRVARTLTP
jgi:formylglycine-generating enzyme required for sulfatase activity